MDFREWIFANGFPRMDFRGWIFALGIDTAENEPQQVAENCYSLR